MSYLTTAIPDNKSILNITKPNKDHYNILTHTYGIYKDVNDNPICRIEKETQMYRTVF